MITQAVIQSLTPFMVSDQSASASALTETPVQDAPVNNSPNFPIEAHATVQGSVASVIHTLSGEPLSVIVRENRAGPKDRGRPFTFIFSQCNSYPKRLTTVAFAEVGVHFSSRYRHIVILASPVV